MPFSISAGVGFALFGIAVMNGVVLIEHVRHLRLQGTMFAPPLLRERWTDSARSS